MATADPYLTALASRLVPQTGSIVDTRARMAERLMNFQAQPVTTAGAGVMQALAGALSGAGGVLVGERAREDQRSQQAADLDRLERAGQAARAREREETREALAPILASLGMGGGAPTSPPASAPAPMFGGAPPGVATGPAPRGGRSEALDMPTAAPGAGMPREQAVGSVREAAAERARILADPNLTGEQQQAALLSLEQRTNGSFGRPAEGSTFRNNAWWMPSGSLPTDGRPAARSPVTGGGAAPALVQGNAAPMPMVGAGPAAAGGPDFRRAALLAAATGNPAGARLVAPLTALAGGQDAAAGRAQSDRHFTATHGLAQQRFAFDRANAPLERVRMPDGSERIVPRPQAAGQVSAAEPDRTLVEVRQPDGSVVLMPRPQAAGRVSAAPPNLSPNYRPTPDGGSEPVRGSPADPGNPLTRATGERQADDTRVARENAFRDEFTARTANFRTVQTAYNNIEAAAAQSSGAGDMSMLYSYVKMLDPGSVVRESEFALAAQSGSFGERVQGAVQRVLTGQRLPDSLRQDFMNEARGLLANNRRDYDQLEGEYRRLATGAGARPEQVIPNFVTPAAPRREAAGNGGTAPAAVAGPNGQGTAAPPSPARGAPQRLRFNPATGRIE